jgi:two-component system CheB/CheR fusion protein
MNDCSGLSRDQLVERLRALEADLDSARREPPIAAAWRESEARLRAILDTAVEAIITIDRRGVIESFNPAAERAFGYAAAEVIGTNVALLMPAPYRQEHDGYLANYLRTGQAKIIGIGREALGLRKDGTVFPMDLSVSEVRLGNKRLFTGFVRDITERKRLEQEILQISELEQRRLGQDLHDGICQHLAATQLMSQSLEQSLARRAKSDAAQAHRVAEHVQEAIVQIRRLARGLCPVVLESEGLMAALQELADSAEKLFRVACRFTCARPVKLDDHNAATHLFRIAQEAVGNAIKHGQPSLIEIQLTGAADRLVLGVRDNGVGIPADLAARKGMGLRIMQYRAGMINGSLVIQREAEGGTSVVCSVRQPASPPPASVK